MTVARRSYVEAGHAALDALDLLRAVWSLLLDSGRFELRVGGTPRPLNRILLGPLRTLHPAGGGRPLDMMWIEQGAFSYPPARHLASAWTMLRANTKRVRRELAASPIGQDLTRGLLRYVRALDEVEQDSAFIRLWGLLETLTATDRPGQSKETAKRAAFLWKDWRTHREVLSHLRERRNDLAHRGGTGGDGQIRLVQLRRCVGHLLLFLLRYRFRFSSLTQAGEFLRLPPAPSALHQRILAAQRALAIHAPPSR